MLQPAIALRLVCCLFAVSALGHFNGPRWRATPHYMWVETNSLETQENAVPAHSEVQPAAQENEPKIANVVPPRQGEELKIPGSLKLPATSPSPLEHLRDSFTSPSPFFGSSLEGLQLEPEVNPLQATHLSQGLTWMTAEAPFDSFQTTGLQKNNEAPLPHTNDCNLFSKEASYDVGLLGAVHSFLTSKGQPKNLQEPSRSQHECGKLKETRIDFPFPEDHLARIKKRRRLGHRRGDASGLQKADVPLRVVVDSQLQDSGANLPPDIPNSIIPDGKEIHPLSAIFSQAEADIPVTRATEEFSLRSEVPRSKISRDRMIGCDLGQTSSTRSTFSSESHTDTGGVASTLRQTEDAPQGEADPFTNLVERMLEPRPMRKVNYKEKKYWGGDDSDNCFRGLEDLVRQCNQPYSKSLFSSLRQQAENLDYKDRFSSARIALFRLIENSASDNPGGFIYLCHPDNKHFFSENAGRSPDDKPSCKRDMELVYEHQGFDRKLGSVLKSRKYREHLNSLVPGDPVKQLIITMYKKTTHLSNNSQKRFFQQLKSIVEVRHIFLAYITMINRFLSDEQTFESNQVLVRQKEALIFFDHLLSRGTVDHSGAIKFSEINAETLEPKLLNIQENTKRTVENSIKIHLSAAERRLHTEVTVYKNLSNAWCFIYLWLTAYRMPLVKKLASPKRWGESEKIVVPRVLSRYFRQFFDKLMQYMFHS